MPEPIEGYAARILDGNVLTGTEHRIVPLRTTWSAGLPGMSLAVYEPASGLILDLILEEDAHCQERALVDRVDVRPGQLWIMDVATQKSVRVGGKKIPAAVHCGRRMANRSSFRGTKVKRADCSWRGRMVLRSLFSRR